MKKLLIVVAIIGLAVFMASNAFCEENEDSDYDYSYSCNMMEPCYGMGMGYGCNMRGSGYGMCMEYGCMIGEGSMQRRGWGRRSRAGKSLNPEQRKKWQKMRSSHMMDTLDLRTKIAAKRVELKTLWAQPEIVKDKIDQLSNEVAMLQAELLKKRNQHLLQCRQKFGGQCWNCPGGWW